MSAQHTPGPFVIDPLYPSEVQTAELKTVASCWMKEHEGQNVIIRGVIDCSPEESAANARLFSAATDLEEALQGALEALAMCQPRTDHGAACQHVAMLAGRAALAKARGEA